MKKQYLDIIETCLDQCLTDPIGDPDRTHLYAAACMVKILKMEGYTIGRETMRQLHKSKRIGGKVLRIDFLKKVEEDMKTFNEPI